MFFFFFILILTYLLTERSRSWAIFLFFPLGGVLSSRAGLPWNFSSIAAIRWSDTLNAASNFLTSTSSVRFKATKHFVRKCRQVSIQNPNIFAQFLDVVNNLGKKFLRSTRVGPALLFLFFSFLSFPSFLGGFTTPIVMYIKESRI